MKIEVNSLSKSFGDKLIFKNFSYSFLSNHSYGISGLNGSGKSTLLKLLSGFSTPDEGSVRYLNHGSIIPRDKIFEHISFIAPYIDIPLSYTFSELLTYHFSFRKPWKSISQKEIEEMFDFPKKQLIQNFSSGMQQRVKLALAFFTDSTILLLDEPTETLDENGYKLYSELLDKYTSDRLVIISSNKDRDFYNVQEVLSIENFK